MNINTKYVSVLQVSQVELGKATKTVYNLPPPPLHVNKTTENQKDIKNDIQKISLNDSICDVDKNKVLTEKDKSLNVGVVADKFKGAARGAVKNLKNVPSKVVRTIKTTQNKVSMYTCVCIFFMYACT